jgi:hypothetical protein
MKFEKINNTNLEENMCKITDHFESNDIPTKYSFQTVFITEKSKPDTAFINYLKEQILFSYRSLSFFQRHFSTFATDDEIRNYVKRIIPPDNIQLDRNVRQGDWGEVLACLIVTYFQNLIVPINKLQWKFNNSKAVFGTDLIAFNKNGEIKDIHYYEIKTRQKPHNKENIKKGKERYYISVLAYKSLEKDASSPTSSIANFLEMFYYEKEDFDNSDKFRDITRFPEKYNSYFEIFLIFERNNFREILLDELEALPPILSPLKVTLVFVDNLKRLVDKTWQDIEEILVQNINGDKK